MQTNLCSADLEMLFTTLRTCANHSSWQENSALDEKSCDVFPAGHTRIAALQNFKNTRYVNHVPLRITHVSNKGLSAETLL